MIAYTFYNKFADTIKIRAVNIPENQKLPDNYYWEMEELISDWETRLEGLVAQAEVALFETKKRLQTLREFRNSPVVINDEV